jgi:hypothetical protein
LQPPVFRPLIDGATGGFQGADTPPGQGIVFDSSWWGVRLAKKAAITIGLCAVTALGAAGIGLYVDDQEAKKEGFTDIFEKHLAQKQGFKDKFEWQEHLATEQRRLANERAEAEKKLAAIEEEKNQKKRADLFKAVSLALSTPMEHDRAYNNLKQAYGAINDFKLADQIVVSAREAKPSNDERKSIDRLEKKIKDGRRFSFPLLRAFFERYAAQELWSNDFKVRVSGQRKENIQFIHHSFALNKNKQTAHEQAAQALRDFNFRKACYSWSESLFAEQTCYAVTSWDAP